MRHIIQQLFQDLESPAHPVQALAVTRIVVLLERLMKYPGSTDKLCAAYLSQDILEHEFSKAEIAEILDETVKSLNSDRLLLSTKFSLFGFAATMTDVRYGGILLHFFSCHADSLNEQDAFSVVAALTNFVMRATEDKSHLKALLEEHDTINVLRKLKICSNDRLRETIIALIDYLNRMDNQG
jgi:ribosomal protein L16 Arg81 hydroxylase